MRCAFADDLSFALPWQIKPYRHPGEWPPKRKIVCCSLKSSSMYWYVKVMTPLMPHALAAAGRARLSVGFELVTKLTKSLLMTTTKLWPVSKLFWLKWSEASNRGSRTDWPHMFR